MLRRAFLASLALAAAFTQWPAWGGFASPHTLYAATVRTGGNLSRPGGGDIPIAGNLYTINLAHGTATLVGPSMAAHPSTGVLYGITSEQSPSFSRSLITIDPATAIATLVGELPAPGSDVSFDSKGTLYMWLPGTSQLAIVDPSNANVMPIGKAGAPGSPAGISVDPQGMVFVTAKGAGGTLDNVDLQTGALQIGPPLTGAPFATQINSMSFSPSGLLLAVN